MLRIRLAGLGSVQLAARYLDLAAGEYAGEKSFRDGAVEFRSHKEGDSIAIDGDIGDGDTFVIAIHFSSELIFVLREAEGEILQVAIAIREDAGPDAGEIGGVRCGQNKEQADARAQHAFII